MENNSLDTALPLANLTTTTAKRTYIAPTINNLTSNDRINSKVTDNPFETNTPTSGHAIGS